MNCTILSGAYLMQTQITRYGDKLMVEISEDLIAEAGFEVGEPLEWVADGSRGLTLMRPLEAAAYKVHGGMTLGELLEGVPDGGVGGELNWGPPRGVEFW